MKLRKDDWKGLLQELESLRSELKTLHERMASLEESRVAAATTPPQAAIAAPPPPVPVALNDDLVTILGAAIAAFLGKKAHIRQIRLLGSAAWAQQGRVTVQASHRL